ncbi:MFS transporter [Streptomyces sp. NPDC001691]|uniref:MFS transporter n=1 Tax=Streptomyces sp. NPDC001691 TaxID=3364600 RepID=UPI003679EE22
MRRGAAGPGRLTRTSPADGGEGFNRELIAPMILGSILNPVNSSMIAVALVPIGQAFGAPAGQTAWLVSALYLATAIGQPVIGRLVDSYGPRRLYLIGTALVGAAGLLGSLAPTLGVLIATRVLLGFGTSAAYPASMSLTRSEADRTGEKSPAGVLTALAVSNQVVAVIGPTLGGLLIGLGGWHWIFAINVPLSAACLILGARRLPRAPAAEAGDSGPGARIDLAGMVLFAAMLIATLLFLMTPQPGHWYLLLIAALATGGFAVRELRAAQPFIDLRVFGGNAPLMATYLRQVLSFVTSYAFLYGFTQWLEEGRGLSASAAGLVQLPMPLSAVLISVTTGRRPQIRGKLVVGSLCQLAACALMLLLHSDSAIWLLLAVGLAMGAPQGLNGLANQTALYHQADPSRMGSAAGLLRTCTYLGAMIASSADAAFFRHGADTAGLHGLGVFMGAGAVLLTAVTLLDRSLRRPAPAGTALPETTENP